LTAEMPRCPRGAGHRSRPAWREIRLFLSLLAAMGLTTPPAIRAQAETTSEYQLKAAFLFNFVKFVDWPADAFRKDAPIRICLIGNDPFGISLDHIVQDKSINDRQLVVFRSIRSEDVVGCHLVFLASSDAGRFPVVFEKLKASSTLIVGESQNFALAGGTIQFFLEDNKVRFYINIDAAERAHLKVSSKLLALAKVIHDDRQRGN
jgi:hypothetical protein